jgi:HSP20 family protein
MSLSTSLRTPFDLSPFEEGFLDRVFGPMERAFWNLPADVERTARQFRPRCDVYETPESVVVHAEMPGVKKEDLKVEIHQDQLSISGEIHTSKEKTEGHRQLSERHFGSFKRTFTIPKNVNAEAIQAKHENGVLEVTLPKMVEAKPKARAIAIH